MSNFEYLNEMKSDSGGISDYEVITDLILIAPSPWSGDIVRL